MGNVMNKVDFEKSNFMPSFLEEYNPFDVSEDPDNGLNLRNTYIPEEVVTLILSYVNPTELLKCSLVCHKWNNIVRSHPLWYMMYTRKYKRKPKNLPWYVYYCLLRMGCFDTNLIKNGSGQQGFDHWHIIANSGNQFAIEDPPAGADPVPIENPDFSNKTSCFSTSYHDCIKEQIIKLNENKLFLYIINNFKPHFYASEWVAGRFDCGSVYKLNVKIAGKKDVLKEDFVEQRIEQWQGGNWNKVELVFKDYPKGVVCVLFQHHGKDTQFWAGNYGSKMSGAVFKVLFNTIEPLQVSKEALTVLE